MEIKWHFLFILEGYFYQHDLNKEMIGDSQHDFTNGKLWWPFTRVTAVVDKGRVMSSMTCAKHLTLSCRTSSSLNWRHSDLMDGSTRQIRNWLDGHTQSDAWVETSDEWCSSGVSTGISVSSKDSRIEGTLCKSANTNLWGAVNSLQGGMSSRKSSVGSRSALLLEDPPGVLCPALGPVT